jgi:uncharacterized protein (TIGR04141 family)
MVKIYRRLNLFMAKPLLAAQTFADLLADALVDTYPIPENLGIDGVLFVRRSTETRPSWGAFLDEAAGRGIQNLVNRSSSAVLLLRVDDDVFAFAFGYGRYLIDQSKFVQDFGLRTALNTLDEKSLRSVDVHTLEDQPVQKKSQAARDSEVGVFGIDILRDVLRAVTGGPKHGVELVQIAGGDAMFSFGAKMEVADLPKLVRRIKQYSENNEYKSSFSWVDNVRKIKDEASIEALNMRLVQAVAERNEGVILTLPEIGTWDAILGFSFTRRKDKIHPVIRSTDYIDAIPDLSQLTIEQLKRDRLFVHDVDGNVIEHPVHRCIYFEMVDGDKTKIIFDGKWYEVDATFIGRITGILNLIEISTLIFPAVEVWEEDGKLKIEAEGDYNIRAAEAEGYFLLDKKLVKTDRATSPIELCDLLTPAKQLVHVKHRKGGSAGLSHLFAQGGVAAEIMLSDKSFRKQARTVLRRVHADAGDLVPLDKVRSADYEVVFLILGEGNETIKQNLPFFSKVNLSRAFENLTQRGFRVSIAGVPTTPRLVT